MDGKTMKIENFDEVSAGRKLELMSPPPEAADEEEDEDVDE